MASRPRLGRAGTRWRLNKCMDPRSSSSSPWAPAPPHPSSKWQLLRNPCFFLNLPPPPGHHRVSTHIDRCGMPDGNTYSFKCCFPWIPRQNCSLHRPISIPRDVCFFPTSPRHHPPGSSAFWSCCPWPPAILQNHLWQQASRWLS